MRVRAAALTVHLSATEPGAVFEAAAITGVTLFETDKEGFGAQRAMTGEILRLLPKAAHKRSRAVKDDF